MTSIRTISAGCGSRRAGRGSFDAPSSPSSGVKSAGAAVKRRAKAVRAPPR